MEEVKSWYAPIISDEIAHKYYKANDTQEELFGITKMIQRQLFPDLYSGISTEVLNRAAQRGKGVHKMLEEQIMTDGEVCEQAAFMKNQLFVMDDAPLRCEQLVWDGKHHASSIDLVTKNLNLIDYKTTSTLHMDVVTWQLNIYAYMLKYTFGVEAQGLYVAWLPENGDYKLIECQRIDEAEVIKLIEAEDSMTQYIPPKTLDPLMPQAIKELMTEERIKNVVEIERQYEELKKKREELTKGLMELMDRANVEKFESKYLNITMVKATKRTTFDSARFKTEHEELYNEYLKESSTSQSIRLKIK